jgi:arabinogalactan oligomer / maltooligosaccharide transport system substrate-binding protein
LIYLHESDKRGEYLSSFSITKYRRRSMSKKFWYVISLLLIAAMALAACKPAASTTTEAPAAVTEAPAATEASAAPVTITIWHQWDGAYLDAITAAFNQYTAEHPNVTIDLSKPEDVSNALSVAIPAGQGPDIIGWANDQIGTQALAGNIIDLGTLGVDQAFLNSTYEPAAVKGVVWQDKIWALPESQEAIALVYNKDLVTDKYLPTDPTNFDDLYTKAEQFQKDTGKVLICNQGFGASDAYHVAPIYFGFGVPTYIDDTGKVYMNTPEAIKAGEWLKKIATVSLKDNSYDICNSAFADGSVGMWWTGPWAIANIEKAGINYGIVSMGKPFVGIKTLMITKNAVDRGTAATALDVIKYFTSAEVQKTVALANKTIPANTAAIKDPAVAALPTLAGFGASANLGVPMANTPYASAQWGPIGDASAAIYTGAQEPQAALDAAQKAAEDAVAAMK